jgi:hypothetical protein
MLPIMLDTMGAGAEKGAAVGIGAVLGVTAGLLISGAVSGGTIPAAVLGGSGLILGGSVGAGAGGVAASISTVPGLMAMVRAGSTAGSFCMPLIRLWQGLRTGN